MLMSQKYFFSSAFSLSWSLGSSSRMGVSARQVLARACQRPCPPVDVAIVDAETHDKVFEVPLDLQLGVILIGTAVEHLRCCDSSSVHCADKTDRGIRRRKISFISFRGWWWLQLRLRLR